jgi:hypothetical protein
MKHTWKVIVGFVIVMSVLSCTEEDANMRSLREAAARGNKSYKEYKNGDYPTAKAALLDYVRYLEEKLQDPAYPHAAMAKVDLTISYVRLAKLEEKNNGPGKEKYMQQAALWCERMEIKKTCSVEELHKQTEWSDEAAAPK